MKARLLAILRWSLMIWGALSLIAVIVIASLVAYQFGPGNRTKTQPVSPRDIRFVLNHCGLGEKRIEKVLHSHISSRSFTGDHLDAHAIKITYVDLGELTAQDDSRHTRWYRGDQLPTTLDDAVKFAGGWLYEIPWFPGESELRSPEIYVCIWSIRYVGSMRPNAVELIFVRPADKIVFYFDAKS